MSSRILLPLVSLLAWLSISCSGVFPGMGILAPDDLAGYEMDATGLKGSYYYEFSADGTYVRDTVKPSGKHLKPLTGTWKWDRKAYNKAVLILDETLVIDLHFTTHEHANAKLIDSERLYPVEFTAPEE